MVLRRSALALSLVMISALVVIGPSGARAAGRPDLVVATGGSAAQSGNQVTATFRVKTKYAGTKSATRAGLGLYGTQSGEFTELGTARVAPMKKGTSRRVAIRGSLANADPGEYQVLGCADYWGKVKERNEKNNCRVIGTATVAGGGELCETVNCDPITPAKYNEVVDYTDVTGKYWIFVPDDDIPGPFKVLISLHGCGGSSADAPWNDADYYGYHYITVSPDGAETGIKCWTPDQPNSAGGERRILDTVKSVTAHFNIDPRQIILTGYSSGGDLAYRTAFYHAELFAGVIATNTAPFQDTGSSPEASIAAADWKFNVYHLAHDADDAYPLAGVQQEINAMTAAGFPVEFVHRPGGHYVAPTNPDNPADGTFWEIQRAIQEHMDDGWKSPAP
jgi:predicted esterase